MKLEVRALSTIDSHSASKAREWKHWLDDHGVIETRIRKGGFGDDEPNVRLDSRIQ